MAYNDSRQAAIRLYRKLKLGWIFNTSTFTGNFLLALLIGYFFRELGYADDINYVFFLSVLAIGLWVTEAIPPFAVGIFIIAVLISNIMSNTAASSILVPLGLALPGIWGFTVPLIVALSCSCALLLPVSTPSNAIAFSTGMIEQKSFRSGGLLMIVLGPVLAFVAVMIYALILGQ
ncbi:transporter permease [Belliella pelovolcani]|uniref:Sodium:sulfate symporter transmembrane region n=1 Tax=Belliella pelovolcani TaxID=529505 RepID=A0A1N7M6B7_9BACT|nr:anion permease [Belliella pelovolcani]SIS81582.1 Sodium:sulfate symporter transmembrane region [Belliella pelovolcani]